jgi:hypothetical protein
MPRNNPRYGRIRAATETAIEALEVLGRLNDIDAARVAALRALADAVDSDPTNASLWREYRATEQLLREKNDPSSDDFTQLLAALSAEMGDTETP